MTWTVASIVDELRVVPKGAWRRIGSVDQVVTDVDLVLTSSGTQLGDDDEVVEIREALVTTWRRVHLAVESTLPRRVTLTRDSVTRTETPRIPSVVLREHTVDWLARYRHLELDEVGIGILLHLRQHARIANADVRKQTGLGTHAATLCLRRLRDQGAILQRGASRSTYYVLAEAADHAPARDQPHLFPVDDPGGDKSGTSRGQVGDKSELSDDERLLLHFAVTPRRMSELMEHVGWSSRSSFLERVVGPLRERGWLSLTIPDKPRSSKQRYQTTARGRTALGGEP